MFQITAVIYLSNQMEIYDDDHNEGGGDNNFLFSAPEQKSIATIAYAVSLTSCGTDAYKHQSQPFAQGAAVLAHSIHKNSFESPSSGSKYGSKLYAFVHPDAASCSHQLESLGYNILIRDTPINASEIKGEFLRDHVVKSGCCGEKEFIKLYSYTLMDHPIVVHLDLDCLVLKPFDDLFDAMLEGPNSPARERIKLMFPNATSTEKSLPSRINAYFTRDYNMVNPGKEHVGVQGGFLIVRPNMTVYEEYREIILEGDFGPGVGWGRKGYGGYFGAQQIQGLCSYYYDYIHPGEAAELNRCYFNAMADNPRQKGRCRTGEHECEDCTAKNVGDIYSVHFTLCQKPWLCRYFERVQSLCHDMHHEWFRMRKDLDESQAQKRQQVDAGKKEISNAVVSGKYKPEHFLGYCNNPGNYGYIPFDTAKFVMD